MPAPALRPYQADAVAQTRAHWQAGHRRVLVALPTGAGKTVTCAAALLASGARNPISVSHTATLREQNARCLPFATAYTVQGLLAMSPERARRLLATVDAVFEDEAHHIPSASWHRYRALLPPGVRIIGASATPARADGVGLGAMFDRLVATVSYSQLLAGGWLAPCRVVPCPDMSPANAYLEHGQGRPGLVFVPTVAVADSVALQLCVTGVRAATLTGELPERQRRQRLAAYSRSELDVLVSPMALAEGFDSPRAAVCVLARQCGHLGTYLQIANRVTRPHPSKGPGSPALLLDLTGAAERHGHPHADRVYSLAGEGIRSATARTERPPPPAPAPALAHPSPATDWAPQYRPAQAATPARHGAGAVAPAAPSAPLAAGRAIGATLRRWLGWAA